MMHPLTFAEASDPLEVDNWLHITESKFGLLHCTEFQKTLYVASSFMGPLVLGGLTSPPLFMTATRSRGPSSARPPVGLMARKL
jgi:hypothetical protein